MYSTKEIKIHVSSLPNIEKEIKQVFIAVFNDYCYRYNLILAMDKPVVSIAIVEYSEDESAAGSTFYVEEYNKIFIQMRDPYISEWEDNPYMIASFLNTFFHELVHACQHLTGRKGFKIRGLRYDKTDPNESYYFDSAEVEARALADFYRSKYGGVLV